MPVEVLIEDDRWADFGLPALATRIIGAACEHLALDPMRVTVSILGCDDARIARLNATFRGRDEPTNVLSFPATERGDMAPGTLPPPGPASAPTELGDIAIAWETTMAEARAANLPAADHVAHLLVHGLLHLLGHDHVHEEEAEAMEEEERRILASCGIPDPY